MEQGADREICFSCISRNLFRRGGSDNTTLLCTFTYFSWSIDDQIYNWNYGCNFRRDDSILLFL